jgi:hypothetical protein
MRCGKYDVLQLRPPPFARHRIEHWVEPSRRSGHPRGEVRFKRYLSTPPKPYQYW